MERLTYVTEKGEVLFHPEDLPDDEGVTITQLAKDGRFKALEIIAERLANYEQVEKHGSYGKWIPVSERLPEYGEVVLCSCTNAGITVSAITFKGLKIGKVVQFGQHYVTAWMPLPEPYRESEEEDGKV